MYAKRGLPIFVVAVTYTPRHTCMAACWAHHQRPSVGTGSRNRQSEQAGRTALLSSRACSSMLSVCFCTLMHYIPLHQTCGITPSCRRSCRPLSSCSMMTASFSLNHSIASTVHEKCETMIAGWRGVDCTVSRRARTYMPGIKDTEWTGHGMCKCLFYGMSVPI